MKETMIWLIPFIGNAISVSIVCGCIGTHIYTRQISTITSALAHFMIGPIALSYAISALTPWSISPFFVSVIACVLPVFAIPIDEQGRLHASREIMILYSFGMAIGFFIAFLIPTRINFEAFLFGSLFTIGKTTTILLYALALIIVIIEIVFYNRFKYIGADDVFFRLRGISVTVFHRIQLFMICIVIIFVLEAVGILMLTAIMTVPSALISLFVKRYSTLLIGSVIVSTLFMICAVIASYIFDVQLSSSAALALCMLYFIARGFQSSYTKQ